MGTGTVQAGQPCPVSLQRHQSYRVPLCLCCVSLQAASVVSRPSVHRGWCMDTLTCPWHSGVGTRGDGDSWPALSQARLPHWLRPSLHFKLLLRRSRLSRALGRTTPSWGPSRMGTPPGQRPVPCPDSRWWLLGPFPVEQQPQGHASGLHIWRPAVALPHLPWAAAPGAADTPAPAGPLLAGTLLNPEDRTGGAAGAPDGATLTAAGPGPWGPRPPCPAGGVGAASGGVWRGHFPAQTDGAGLEPWLPQGGGWIWYG